MERWTVKQLQLCDLDTVSCRGSAVDPSAEDGTAAAGGKRRKRRRENGEIEQQGEWTERI